MLMYPVLKIVLRAAGAFLLLLPALSLAATDLLLDEQSLAAKIGKEPNYQLLDARSGEARRLTPLPFSIRYDRTVAIGKGLVFVVADSDAAALEIAQSIAATGNRNVFAVKGGADAWKRVQSKSATVVAPGFVVPKGTCDLGEPSLEFEAPSGKKAGEPAHESITK